MRPEGSGQLQFPTTRLEPYLEVHLRLSNSIHLFRFKYLLCSHHGRGQQDGGTGTQF